MAENIMEQQTCGINSRKIKATLERKFKYRIENNLVNQRRIRLLAA
jgi:hypothetical protein